MRAKCARIDAVATERTESSDPAVGCSGWLSAAPMVASWPSQPPQPWSPHGPSPPHSPDHSMRWADAALPSRHFRSLHRSYCPAPLARTSRYTTTPPPPPPPPLHTAPECELAGSCVHSGVARGQRRSARSARRSLPPPSSPPSVHRRLPLLAGSPTPPPRTAVHRVCNTDQANRNVALLMPMVFDSTFHSYE